MKNVVFFYNCKGPLPLRNKQWSFTGKRSVQSQLCATMFAEKHQTSLYQLKCLMLAFKSWYVQALKTL